MKRNRKTFTKEDLKASINWSCVKDKRIDCWPWQPTVRLNKTYPVIKVKGKLQGVARMVYRLFVGRLSSRFLVVHRCGNRFCVNPRHLRSMTAGEISTTFRSGRRWKRSEYEKWGRRLTWKKVKEIRKRYVGNGTKPTLRELGSEYGVSAEMIRLVVSRLSWNAPEEAKKEDGHVAH